VLSVGSENGGDRLQRNLIIHIFAHNIQCDRQTDRHTKRTDRRQTDLSYNIIHYAACDTATTPLYLSNWTSGLLLKH